MSYHGYLRTNEDAAPGLAVRIDIGDDEVVLLDASEILGSWPADDVVIERIDGDVFKIELGDELFTFESADRLSFGYEGLRKLEEAQLRLNRGLRGRLRRRRRSTEAPTVRPNVVAHRVSDPANVPPVSDEPASIQAASAAAVFARGYADPIEAEPPNADSPEAQETDLPTSDSLQPTWQDSEERLSRVEAVALLSSMAGVNGATDGASSPLSEKLASSLNGDNAIPAVPGRAQEYIRSPRLEREEAIPHSKPPADPWDTGSGHQADGPIESPPSPLDDSVALATPPISSPPPAQPPPPPSPTGRSVDVSDSTPSELSEPSPTPAEDAAVEAIPETSHRELGTNTAAQPVAAEVIIDLTETASSRSLMDRLRRKRHEHTFSEDTVSGGIVRRVCSECHHVSIGAS